MAIKFEDAKDGITEKPAGAKPAAKARVDEGATSPTEPGAELPFGKPVRPEKKGRRK